MDGAYASRAWRDLPARVSVTTRMRANAALHKLAPASHTPGQQGRPPLEGARLESLAEIAKAAIFIAVTITGPDGRQCTADIHEFVCLWYEPFYTRAVKVILIRNPGTTDAFDVALARPTPRSQQPNSSLATTAVGRSKPPIKKPRPAASARPATASRKQSNGPSRSALSPKQSLSPGTRFTATPKPTSRHADGHHRATGRRPPSATPTCSPRYDANSSVTSFGHKHPR